MIKEPVPALRPDTPKPRRSRLSARPLNLEELTSAVYVVGVGMAPMTRSRVHGFTPSLTRFIGRAGAADDVARLLDEGRLVTVTGPGGVGKTRLAAEVAERVSGRFADGVWLVELATVLDPALVPAATAAVLGVREQPGVAVTDVLAGLLARQQMLLVLDNCEHLAAAVAEMCAALLPVADDVRILATSREPLGVAGEARYRLPPLTLPAPDDPDGTSRSEAVALFADRARRADRRFSLNGDSAPAVARLATRLDGMPLAIELAAARVEALGLAQLLDRLDDQFVLLARADRAPGAARHRSLAAVADWSYQLLSEADRRVFRRVCVFPAPFTLEAAEAVAGQDAGPGVLRLVDCSLLAPPRAGPDGRSRYLMLETLRGYGLGRLAEAGEGDQASAAMARYAVGVTGQAAAGLQAAAGELAAVRWLDAEDALTRHALAWALDHDQDAALRLAVGLFPWWRLRGRLPDGEPLLRAAVRHAEPGTGVWGEAQCRLGQMAMSAGDFTTALGHFRAVRDSGTDQSVLADALAGSCVALANLGRTAEAVEDGQRALAIARRLRYPVGEALALTNLAIATYYVGNVSEAVGWARQAQRVDRGRIPGAVARVCDNILALVLIAVGEFAAAGRCCAAALDSGRQVGDLQTQAALLTLLGHLDLDADRLPDAAAHLQEAVQIALRINDETELLNCIDNCGHLCAATGRWADAITLWAALAAYTEQAGLTDPQDDALRRREPQREAARALGPARTREAEHRGAAMTLAIAAEFAAMLTTAEAPRPGAQLSPRERELVTLVAQGCTDAQIAAQLFISVRTVRSHLDRIRDKTGCRRRADLTRLALQADLV
jgi:predicted ATPase/DNA-binding CsgD family transcriptional regulator